MNQKEPSHTKKITLYGKGIESYSREVEVADLEEFKRQIELQLVQTGKPITAVFKTNDEDGFIDGIADLYRDSQALQMAISIGEEVALTFIPFGQQVDKLTDKVHQSITKNTVMSKKKTQSKTWWGIIVTLISSILGAVGIAADPSFLNDGFNLMADLEMLIAFAGAIIGWAIKSWGQRTAEDNIR